MYYFMYNLPFNALFIPINKENDRYDGYDGLIIMFYRQNLK